MKRLIVVIVMYFALSLLACQDTKEGLGSRFPDNAFYKSVGKEIPFETGMRWLEFYNNKNDKQSRIGLSSYSISASQTRVMLQSVSDLSGVAFHYGIDESGTKHIVAIPVDGSLSLWSSISGRIFVDANSGNEISQDVARLWTQNFQNVHPNEIWFHFFGRYVFDDMNTLSYFNSIDIEPALNDLNLTPQLLLIIWNDGGLLPFGRTKGDGGKVYDASNPCPPCGIQ